MSVAKGGDIGLALTHTNARKFRYDDDLAFSLLSILSIVTTADKLLAVQC